MISERTHLCQRAFTLVEMMITIAVLAIVLGIGVPSMSAFIESNRLTSVTNDLLSSLQYARAEALRQRSRVTICQRAANSDACDDNGNWANGWLIYLDDNPAATPVANSEGLLRIVSNLNAGNLVISGSAQATSYVSFSGNGGHVSWSGSPITLTLNICSKSSVLNATNRARDIFINPTGRTQSTKSSNAAANCTRSENQ